MAKTNKREIEEKSENLQTVTNDAPESKYQGNQQVANSTGFKVDSGKSSFIPEKKKAPGSTLKQEVAASVVKDSSFGGSNSGDGMSFAGTRSSGSVGGVLGAANATPVADKARSDSRTSKKLDRNSTKMNYIPSDQVLVEWDESKPLADSANDDQGFNGTYRNEFARTQKNKEAVPGALMFDRSVDLLVKDNIYFGQGQKVTQSGVTSKSDLTVTATPNTKGIYEYPSSANYSGSKTGNYLNENIEILFNADGRPIYTVYNDTDLSTAVDQFDANKSSAQDHILMNDAELVRETMDSKAGDEKAEAWSCLPRAVMQPTELLGFLRDLESSVGDEIITAYRKASTSLSFQLNRSHKDGQDTTNPAILALLGLNYNYVSKAAATTGLGSTISGCFSRANYLNGSASTMVALYDSTAKYSTKADFLIQPRSFRMHLQTADNNMDPFYTSKLFNQAYDVEEVFSTIDRDYDPMSPICMTDKAAVIHRISLHKMGSYIYNHLNFKVKDTETTAPGKFVIVPKAMAAEIKTAGTKIHLVYPKELVGDINYNASTGAFEIESTYEFTGGKNFTVYIQTDAPTYDSDNEDICTVAGSSLKNASPIYFDGSAPSSHKFAVSEVAIAADAEKFYCYQGGPCYYKYNDLRNVYVVKVAHPITDGLENYFVESIGAKYFKLLTENSAVIAPVTINTTHSTMFFSLWSFLLCAATPWIVKSRINSFRDVLYYEKNYEYPFSSTLIPVKDILSKAYKNFGYSNYDTELTVGLMTPAASLSWILPELCQQVGYDSGTGKSQVLMPWYTNQNAIRYKSSAYNWDNDASAMSFPSIRSGVRLASLDNLYGMSEKDVRLAIDMISSFKSLSPTLSACHTYKYSSVGDGQLILAIDLTSLTTADFLKLPRELGFVITAPYGVLTPNYSHVKGLNGSFVGNSSFRAYYWLGANPTVTDDQGTQSILQSITINVNRAQNFTQDWYCVLASGTVPATDHGFCLSATHAFSSAGALLAGRSSFTPYTTLADEGNGVYSTNMNSMRSLQKFLWTRIQKLPFVISPFDIIYIDNTSADPAPNSVVLNDPFDLCYIFGLGGFRASDYRESVYNREKEVVNQGILFVSDPWIEDSPIFKEGSVTSGISVSKGFEL